MDETMDERKARREAAEAKRQSRVAEFFRARDFRSVCDTSGFVTTVSLDTQRFAVPWGLRHAMSGALFVFGACEVYGPNPSLRARARAGVVDCEDDSCLVASIPLIGVAFDVAYRESVSITAWVDPNGDIVVPVDGYDPQAGGPDVPAEYCPSVERGTVDVELVEYLRGKPVKISIFPASTYRDEDE